jgi:AcrR family transcriptional regulator
MEGTRERLLTEARDLYLEVGIELSLREVARRAGVSAPAVYRHFENKDQLLRAVCAEGFQLFASYLMLALEAGGPKERLIATTKQYLHFGLEHPRDYRVLFMGEPSDLEFAPKKGERAPTYQFLVDRVREAGLTGDPDETAIVIWAHVHGLVSLRLSGALQRLGSDAKFHRFYDEAVKKLISALG